MTKKSAILCITFVLLCSNSSALFESFRYLVQREWYSQWYYTSNRLHISVFNVTKLKVSQHLWKIFVNNTIQIHSLAQAAKLSQKFMSKQLSILSVCWGKFSKLRSDVHTIITVDVPTKLERVKMDPNNTIWISTPCQHVVDKTKNFVANAYSRILCFSTWLNLTRHREELQFRIQENNLFHLNLSFVAFKFTSHLWCYTDFMHISKTSETKQVPGYIFCGTRHPWTILLKSNSIRIWTVAKPRSRFILQYQIMESNLIQSFHICDNILCSKKNSSSHCKLNLFPHYFLHHVIHTFQGFYSLQKQYIFNLRTCRHKYLQLSGQCYSCIVFDSPIVGLNPLNFTTNKYVQSNLFQMNSFQGTIVFL